MELSIRSLELVLRHHALRGRPSAEDVPLLRTTEHRRKDLRFLRSLHLFRHHRSRWWQYQHGLLVLTRYGHPWMVRTRLRERRQGQDRRCEVLGERSAAALLGESKGRCQRPGDLIKYDGRWLAGCRAILRSWLDICSVCMSTWLLSGM